MIARVRELSEKRGQIWTQMCALDLSVAENRTKFGQMDDEQKGYEVEIRAINESEARKTALDLELRQPADASRRENQPAGGDSQDVVKEQREKERKAFLSYLKHGDHPEIRGGYRFKGVTAEERQTLYKMGQKTVEIEARDMGTGGEGAYPGATTGFFVPVGFTMQIEDALKYYGDMWNVAEILDTATGQPLPYPTDNDTTVTGELIGEGQQVTEQDVSLGQIMFGAYKFSSKMVKVSIELLQDSAFDLQAFLIKKFATRLGRITNTMFTTGGGPTASQPNGIITAATNSGVTVIGNDNLTTPNPTNQVGYIDLVDLEHSVDPLYRKGAKFMFHDQTLRYLKTLKDNYGRPLWMPGFSGLANTQPDTLNGYKYSINNDMAQLGPSGSPPVGSISVAFGPLDKYVIRRVKEMSVLRLVERFADYGQVAFLAFARYDGQLLDAGTHPVQYLQNAA
jgi:HK97 family phage major capsid protein